MADADMRNQISRIEADIEELAKTLEGCRKAMLLSKVAIVSGGIWILGYLLGAISFNAAAMISAMAAVIGGIVIFGSNLSSSKRTATAMKAAETHRAELIDLINLRTVGESREGTEALVRNRDWP